MEKPQSGLPGYMLKNTSPGQDRCVFCWLFLFANNYY